MGTRRHGSRHMSEEKRYKDFIRDFSDSTIWCNCTKPMKLKESYRQHKLPENCYFFVCEECAKKSAYKCERVGQ